MRRLLLLRHAKAVSSSDHGDHGRGLNPRGRRDAAQIGRAMQARGLVPDLVLCSTAKRAAETWELAAPELKKSPRIEFNEVLYLAAPRAIATLIREKGQTAQTVLVVGHNPGLEETAAMLLGAPQSDGEQANRAAMAEKFPTGALAALDCRIPQWEALAAGTAALAEFLKPHDLAD